MRGGGGCFTRRLQAQAGWEQSQERFAPKAASPYTGGELRLPLADEQTLPEGGGGGGEGCVCAVLGWDR